MTIHTTLSFGASTGNLSLLIIENQFGLHQFPLAFAQLHFEKSLCKLFPTAQLSKKKKKQFSATL